MNKLSSISVFFPAFNDEKTIPGLLEKTVKLLPKIASSYEIIIVDDGSKDGTANALENFRKKIPFLRVITHWTNKGYGAALKSGFANSKKDFIFYTDGDGQYNVNELKNFIKLMREDVDIVNGYKTNRADKLIRRVLGNIYSFFIRLIFRLKISDVDCDFRLIRKSVLNKIRLTRNSGAICVELVKKIQDGGFNIVEAPVHHYSRTSGKSMFFNAKSILKTLFDDFLIYIGRA